MNLWGACTGHRMMNGVRIVAKACRVHVMTITRLKPLRMMTMGNDRIITPKLVGECCDWVETMCGKATPGPWKHGKDQSDPRERADVIISAPTKVVFREPWVWYWNDAEERADRDFVCAARTLLPSLVPVMRLLADHVHIFGGVTQDNELLEACGPFCDEVARLQGES